MNAAGRESSVEGRGQKRPAMATLSGLRPSTLDPRPLQRAFTLMEIMVVVAIIGLIMAMGVPTIYRLFRKEGFRKSVSDVIEVCAAARAQAILTGEKTKVMFHPHAGKMEVIANTPATNATGGLAYSVELEGGTAIEALGINGGDYTDFQDAWVQFFPNGSCEDLKLVLRSAKGDEVGVELDVITAQARIVPFERFREWLIR